MNADGLRLGRHLSNYDKEKKYKKEDYDFNIFRNEVKDHEIRGEGIITLKMENEYNKIVDDSPQGYYKDKVPFNGGVNLICDANSFFSGGGDDSE